MAQVSDARCCRGASGLAHSSWQPPGETRRRITADTALRLARFFGTSERFWLNLQARYDLEIEKDKLGGTLDDIRPLGAAIWRACPELICS